MTGEGTSAAISNHTECYWSWKPVFSLAQSVTDEYRMRQAKGDFRVRIEL